MESLHKWNIKIGNFLAENEGVGQILRQINGFVKNQVELHPRSAFISFIFIIFLIIYNRPWIIIVISSSLFIGFHSIDFLRKNLLSIVVHIKKQRVLRIRKKNNSSSGGNGGEEETLEKFLDPLLHNSQNLEESDIFKESQRQEEALAGKYAVKTTGAASSRLKINRRLDKSIARFCSLVFEAYISPDWAPYETRKQLKLAFVKLLTHFGESLVNTFEVPDNGASHSYAVSFCRDKIIPLAFFHLKNAKRERLSPMKMKRALWKIRRLCRIVLELNLPREDQKCSLWLELCVSVLADGVLWNLILLGRDEIPPLIEKIVNEKLNGDNNKNHSSSTSQHRQNESTGITDDPGSGSKESSMKAIDEIDGVKAAVEIKMHGVAAENPNTSTKTTSSSQSATETSIPFLLDSFLDPSHDVEQPAMIVSRWRPTLNDILNERELLYALIQYLRAQKSLEFLQAVLDDSPDGSEYCRKILELEYLPGFCRSKLFLESLGLNRIDEVGLEAGVEASHTLKKPSGHTRSASYGTERDAMSSGIKLWKIEKGIVDGIAIYNDKLPPAIACEETVTVDASDSIFRRRHVLESFITKFFNSVNNFGKPLDPLAEPETARRLGIDYKDYEDSFHPDVLSSIDIEPCDILTETTNLVASWMTKAKWLKYISAGWMKLLHPFIKPKFDTYLDKLIADFLSVNNFVQFVDFVSEAFAESILNTSVSPLSPDKYQSSPNNSGASSLNHNSLEKYLPLIFENIFDINGIINSLKENGDEFIPLCVDLLDILTTELSLNAATQNAKLKGSPLSKHSTSSASSE